MRIQRLEIENFRGIRKMQLDFHPRLNVFAGVNGIGKTTILNALSRTIDIARLNNVAGSERQELENRGLIYPDDIQLGTEQARLRLQLHFRDQCISTMASSRPDEISSDLADYFPGTGTELPHRFFSEERSALAGTWSPSEKTINRIAEIDPWIKAIINDTTHFSHYFNWISEREALENNKLRRFIDSGKEFGKDHFVRDHTLQLVKNAVEEITGFAGLFHDRELYEFTLRKNVGSEENILLFSQLSSGEQHLVAFVTMIAVYLALSFPEAENPLHEEAVFLIDALELHLHPSWQRELIPKLLHSFPNCQFIITTHSPQVLGNVKPESIFLLKREDDEIVCEQPDESYGMTMDRVLELVMDEESRPNQKIREDIESLFEHISREEFDKASDLIKALKQDIPSDPEVIRAEMLLHKNGLSL
ncbi:AAA family ATPase [Candidatus Electrothrix sp.]|uniref:AAA family ATPase n=1 Tax=Candidatus Electrothrix sp. TaxID=2170559 RepID=UPI00405647A3